MLYPLHLDKRLCLDRESEERVIYRYSPTSGATIFDHDTGQIDNDLLFGEHKREVDFTIILTNWRIIFRLVSRQNRCTQHVEMPYSDFTQLSVNSDSYLSIFGDHHSFTIYSGGTVFISNDVLCFGFQPARPHFVAGQIGLFIVAAVLNGTSHDEAISLLNQIDFSSLRIPSDLIEINNELVDQLQRVGIKVNNDEPLIIPEPILDLESNVMAADEKAALKTNSTLNDNSSLIRYLRMPVLSKDVESVLLVSWFKEAGDLFYQGDLLFTTGHQGKLTKIYAEKEGRIIEIYHDFGPIIVGEILASFEAITDIHNESAKNTPEKILANQNQITETVPIQNTSSAVKSFTACTQQGQIPSFIPSKAEIPQGFQSIGTDEADLLFAINNPDIGIQSFFGDLNPVMGGNINDDVINIPCFDEDLYARLSKEMHRYTMAELSDKKDSLAKENARLGTFVGALFGVLISNPLAPFIGRNLGRGESDRGKRISEFLPDPHLLFYQDEHSFLSWSRAQVLAPRIRRIIFSKMKSETGGIYYRLLPSLVTPDSVLPIQLFKLDTSSYFYRPFAAGIDRRQQNYDAVKVQRRYMHVHSQGTISKSEVKISVLGSDIESYETSIYWFSGQSLDYFYADFKILPGYVF